MHRLEFVEFYVTNMCNLSCNGCNRFSNLKLSGYEDWKKYRNDYKNFSQYVDVSEVSVLGGEPTMHPAINDILIDLRSWFPNKRIRLVTNGLLLNKIKNLKETIINNKITLDINIHNKSLRLKIYNNLLDFTKISKIKFKWNKGSVGQYIANFLFEGVTHMIYLSNHFNQNSLGHPVEQKLKPYTSDPALAWKACYTKCPTIAEGKIFKCPVSHTMPVAIRQKNYIEYTEKQKELIDSFPYFKCNEIQNVTEKEFNVLMHQQISQCSLCPEKYFSHPINEQEISANYLNN